MFKGILLGFKSSWRGKKKVHLEAIRQGIVNSNLKITIGKWSPLVKQTFLRKQCLVFLGSTCWSTCPSFHRQLLSCFWDRLCFLFCTGAVPQPLLTPTPIHMTLRRHLVLEIKHLQRDLWSSHMNTELSIIQHCSCINLKREVKEMPYESKPSKLSPTEQTLRMYTKFKLIKNWSS